MTEDEREAQKREDKFRDALIEYLRGEDCLSDNSFLTNFMVIGTAQMMDDPNSTSVICNPSNNFPFAYQLGVLEYAAAHHKGDVMRRGSWDED